MSEATNTRKPTLSLATQLGYGVGSLLGDSPYANLIAYQVLFYLTEVLMIDTLVSASVYSIVQWIKFLTMGVAGVIVDSVVLRWGRFRSWCIVGAVMLAVSTPLTFFNFGFKSVFLTCAVFLVTLTINQLGYNIAWTAQRTLPIKMGRNTADIIALNAWSSAGMSGGAVIYSAMFTFATTKIQGTIAYTILAVMIGLFMLACTALLAVISKKYDPPTAPVKVEKTEKKEDKGDKVGFMEQLRSLKGPAILYLVSFTMSCAKDGFFYALLAYFTTYVLQDPAAYALSLSAASVLGVVGAFVQIPLVNWLGKKKDFIYTHILLVVCFVLIKYIGGTSIIFIILRAAIGFIGGCCGGLMGAFAVDLADYNEMKGVSNAKAFLQSVGGMTVRIGSIISTSIAGFALAASGYVAGTEMTQKVLDTILNWMAFGPAVFCAVSIVCIFFFKLDENEIDAYRATKAAPAEE